MLDWENQSRATQPERQKKNKQGRVGVALTKWAFQGLKENRAIFGAFGALKGRGDRRGAMQWVNFEWAEPRHFYSKLRGLWHRQGAATWAGKWEMQWPNLMAKLTFRENLSEAGVYSKLAASFSFLHFPISFSFQNKSQIFARAQLPHSRDTHLRTQMHPPDTFAFANSGVCFAANCLNSTNYFSHYAVLFVCFTTPHSAQLRSFIFYVYLLLARVFQPALYGMPVFIPFFFARIFVAF